MLRNAKLGNWALFSTIVALALSACGGGGASVTPAATVPPSTGTSGSANHAPAITGSPRSAVTAGASYSFTPSASDTDGDSLTYSIKNKPSWASFNTSNGTLSGSPSLLDVGTAANVVIDVTDGTETAQLAGFDITVSTGKASLNWSAPSVRSDATPLLLSEIGGYRVYHGTTATTLEVVATITDYSTTEHSIESLTAGSHYFAVTTYDQYGSESELSNVGMKTIN